MSKKEIVFYGISALIIIWFVLSIFEVQTHNLDHGYQYNKANAIVLITTQTETMTVVGCEVDKPTDSFLVTVRDSNGNEWDYYDTEYQYNGHELNVTMRNREIIDLSEIKGGN